MVTSHPSTRPRSSVSFSPLLARNLGWQDTHGHPRFDITQPPRLDSAGAVRLWGVMGLCDHKDPRLPTLWFTACLLLLLYHVPAQSQVSFLQPLSIQSPPVPPPFVTADFNGDGKLDLASPTAGPNAGEATATAHSMGNHAFWSTTRLRPLPETSMVTAILTSLSYRRMGLMFPVFPFFSAMVRECFFSRTPTRSLRKVLLWLQRT